MDRKQVIEKVGYLLDTYCNGCFLAQYHRKEFGKKYAQSFCIHKCTVGCELKSYGKKLIR
ncbi:zinc-finger domain-containing protein [Calidifontibacillus erzurumensis]|uniref:Zinc-finger domain-containing protein n=1 Tax=Calidifontibacillus erzurumensis TaxID=2741433 RepID=A0A8J8GFX5_9BACI|nr:zinc-finger domain-containing protein [Calidifontibacillus erzurumensis]NSL52632.1 zinc-finger domain-containing protein [Calidifontibacillus erzurumensis]